ncbi:MAG: efflux RND transporter periplasmic adaptor subunit [Gemmataceae bacterium]
MNATETRGAGHDGPNAVPESEPGFMGRAVRSLTTVAAVGLLAGLGYWGHSTEWTLGFGRHGTDRETTGQSEVARVTPGPGKGATVTFDSAEAVDKAGVEVAPVWKAAMTEAVLASGELAFDPRATARLSSRAAGVAHRIDKAVGDPVQAGETIALIDAADVGKAKADFQQTLVQVRLKRKAATGVRSASSAVPEQQQREAEAALRDAEVRLAAAEQALVNLGLSVRATDYEGISLDEVVRRTRGLGVTGDPTTANLLPVRAPLAGVVLSRDVVTGETVEPGKVLFVVVDPRRMWLTLHVAADDVRRVKVGQSVLFKPDGSTAEVAGTVSWVGTSADETTRTVPVRAELANDGGQLRASTLGRGRVVLRTAADAVVVPPKAVHTLGGESVVFVRDPDFLKPGGAKAFRVRVVRTGAATESDVEILDGLKLNEIVAAGGSRMLLGELRRANLSTALRPGTEKGSTP